MKSESFFLKVDSRARISLKKVTKELSTYYKAYEVNGKIILEPIEEKEDVEAWLFKPENKKILKEVKEALKQKGTIKRESFKKYIKAK